LDDVKETTGYWKLKEEALESILWGTLFGIVCRKADYGLTECMNKLANE